MSQNNESEFVTADELAARLRVARATVYRLVKRGELPAYTVGRSLRFARADVEAFLARCRGVRLG